MKIFALLFACLLFLYACTPTAVEDETVTVAVAEDSVVIHFSSLPVLDTNYVYEAWMVNLYGTSVSLAKFRFPPQNDTQLYRSLDTAFYGGTDNVVAMYYFFLSIEPKTDQDPSPSRMRLLGASFDASTDDTAISTIAHYQSFGANFLTNLSTTTLRYILSTPTDGNATTNESSGLWFTQTTSGGDYVSGIYSLPSLPSGWKYEGWLVRNGNPSATALRKYLSTGKFIANQGADEAHPYSLTTAKGYDFPGEDFLTNAPSGFTFPFIPTAGSDAVMISIEPDPDDNKARPFLPSFLATLDAITTNVVYNPTPYVLGNAFVPSPTAMVVRK